jgi:hypothetical protein
VNKLLSLLLLLFLDLDKFFYKQLSTLGPVVAFDVSEVEVVVVVAVVVEFMSEGPLFFSFK